MYKKIALVAIKLAFITGLILIIFKPEWLAPVHPGLSAWAAEKFEGISFGSLWQIIREADKGTFAAWLAFAAGVKLLGIAAGVVRWKLLLRGQGLEIPLWYMVKCWFMGRAIGLLLPGTLGLDGYRLVESSRYTGEVIKCTTVIAVEKLIGFIALTLLVFLTFPLGFGILDFNPVLFGMLLVGLAGFVTVSFLLLLNPRVIQILVAVVPTPRVFRQTVDKLGAAATAYSRQRGTLLLAVVFGLLVHLGTCFMYFGTMSAVRAENTTLLDVLFAAPLYIYGSVIAPTVSGIGVREFVFGSLLGAKAGSGTAVLFGHLGFWTGEAIPFLLSVPLLLWTTRPKRTELLDEAKDVRDAAAAAGSGAIHLAPAEVARYRSHLIAGLGAGLLGGLTGGIIVGLAEAGWLSVLVGGQQDYGLFWWGPAVYGLIFGAAGLGAGAGLVFLYLLANRFPRPRITFALSAGAVWAAACLIAGRWRFQRDILQEHAPTMAQNAAVLAVAFGVGVVIALLAYAAAGRMRGSALRSIAAVALAWAVVTGLGWAGAAALRPTPEPPVFAPEADAQGPNMVLVAVDTLRRDFLPVYNLKAEAVTPALDAFAADSMVFDEAIAQSSWTKPSFASIVTGLYPEAHTAIGKTSILPDSVTTVAEVLRDGGYYTKGFSNNPNITRGFNFDQGFVDYVDLEPSLLFGAPSSARKLFLYEILRLVRERVVNARLLGGRIVITDFYQPAEVITDTGLAWIDSAARPENAPFFLFLHYMDPHDPFQDPERPGKGYARAQLPNPDPERYRDVFIRSYNHEIEYLDRHLGRLFEGLKEQGLYGDTLIVFTSDHGEEFHDHGGWWHGLSLYDEQIHVPLIIKLPGGVNAGNRAPELVRHVDLAPSFAAMAGLEPDPAMQGRALFSPRGTYDATDVGHVHSHLDFEGIVMRSLRTPTHKLIEANDAARPPYAPPTEPLEFYDIAADPAEQQNLADDPAAGPERLRLHDVLEQMNAFITENAAEPGGDDIDPELEQRMRSIGYL